MRSLRAIKGVHLSECKVAVHSVLSIKQRVIGKLLMLTRRIKLAKEQPVLIFCRTNLHQSDPQITAVAIYWNYQSIRMQTNQQVTTVSVTYTETQTVLNTYVTYSNLFLPTSLEQ